MSFFSRLFRRKGRVNVGKYKAPKPAPLAPIDRVVDEGVMIAVSSVRMSIKNDLIVAALRDDESYDADELKRHAKRDILALAEENEETVARLDEERSKRFAPEDDDEEHRRRPLVHRRLARALRAKAEDDEAIAAVVDEARTAAWDEVGRELRQHIGPPGFVPEQPDVYEKMRDSRLDRLISVDFAELLREHPRSEDLDEPPADPDAVPVR